MGNAYFLFNNLKIDRLHQHDAPPAGFEVCVWDYNSWIDGTLFDIGGDAGFSPLGPDKVYGQIWIARDASAINQLYPFLGLSSLTEPYITKAQIDFQGVRSELSVTAFKLKRIHNSYNVVKDGKWTIVRSYRK